MLNEQQLYSPFCSKPDSSTARCCASPSVGLRAAASSGRNDNATFCHIERRTAHHASSNEVYPPTCYIECRAVPQCHFERSEAQSRNLVAMRYQSYQAPASSITIRSTRSARRRTNKGRRLTEIF